MSRRTSRQEANIIATQGRHHLALHKEQFRRGEHIAPSQERLLHKEKFGPKKIGRCRPLHKEGVPSRRRKEKKTTLRETSSRFPHRQHCLSTGDIVFPQGTMSFHQEHYLSKGATSSFRRRDIVFPQGRHHLLIPACFHCEKDPNPP